MQTCVQYHTYLNMPAGRTCKRRRSRYGAGGRSRGESVGILALSGGRKDLSYDGDGDCDSMSVFVLMSISAIYRGHLAYSSTAITKDAVVTSSCCVIAPGYTMSPMSSSHYWESGSRRTLPLVLLDSILGSIVPVTAELDTMKLLGLLIHHSAINSFQGLPCHRSLTCPHSFLLPDSTFDCPRELDSL